MLAAGGCGGRNPHLACHAAIPLQDSRRACQAQGCFQGAEASAGHPPSFMTSSYCSTVLSPELGVQCAATQLREQPVGKAMPAFSPFSSISLRTAGGRQGSGNEGRHSLLAAMPATSLLQALQGGHLATTHLPSRHRTAAERPASPAVHHRTPFPTHRTPFSHPPESSSFSHSSVMRMPGLAMVCTYDRTWRCTSAAWRTCGAAQGRQVEGR